MNKFNTGWLPKGSYQKSRTQIPEVEEATRVRTVSKMVVRYGEHAFNEDNYSGIMVLQ